MASEMPIGRRVQMYRLRRGLTQNVLAGRIGRSASWLSQVERGIRSIENWRVILELADVLRCDPRDLVGQPLTLAPNGGMPFQGLAELRSVLTSYEWLLAGDEPAPASGVVGAESMGALRRRVHEANRVYQAARYEEAARILVRVIREAERHRRTSGASVDDRSVHVVLAEAYHAVAKTLTKIDQTELAWVAAERGGTAAERSGDPRLLVASAYHLGHAFRRAGRVQEAITVADRAYDALMRRPGVTNRDAPLLGLAGGLTLTAVIAAASDGDRSSVVELMDRAEALADELSDDRNDYWFAFGPTNVMIHRLALAVEMGEPREAIRVGEQIDTDRLPSGLVGRRTAVMLDLARAYGQLRMDAAAMNMLLAAERLGAETVRYNKFARELTRELLRREHRPTTPQLRPFAQRIGVLD